jgi:hypothetical protein
MCPVCGSRKLTEKKDRQSGEIYWVCSEGHNLDARATKGAYFSPLFGGDPSAKHVPAKPTLDQLDRWGDVRKW